MALEKESKVQIEELRDRVRGLEAKVRKSSTPFEKCGLRVCTLP